MRDTSSTDTATRPQDRALIIGGGIGGLAAAVALKRLGFAPVVFERVSEQGAEHRRTGAGVSLWSNAIRALQKLELAEPVIAAGTVLERVVTLNSQGVVLSESAVGELGRHLNAPSVCVRRADLLNVLAGALPPDVIQAGAECSGCTEDRDGVTARFQDGREERGAFLVGADGIHSGIRAQLRGKASPRYAGYTCWRGIAELSHPDFSAGRATVVTGRGSEFGLFPCGPGLVYWFCTLNSAAGSRTPPGGVRPFLSGLMKDRPSLVQEAIAATPEEAIYQNDILDRKPIWPWGRGRVTLLGDAAHPATPNLGQGACQALEDAVVLAFSLRRIDDAVACLRIYETWRRFPTARIIRRSRMAGRVMQWQHPLAVAARDHLLRQQSVQRHGNHLLTEMFSSPIPELDGS